VREKNAISSTAAVVGWNSSDPCAGWVNAGLEVTGEQQGRRLKARNGDTKRKDLY